MNGDDAIEHERRQEIKHQEREQMNSATFAKIAPGLSNIEYSAGMITHHATMLRVYLASIEGRPEWPTLAEAALDTAEAALAKVLEAKEQFKRLPVLEAAE